jgi:hypothetical protein
MRERATLSTICSGRLAPISAELTRGSRKVHVSASCARLCPRRCAIFVQRAGALHVRIGQMLLLQ